MSRPRFDDSKLKEDLELEESRVRFGKTKLTIADDCDGKRTFEIWKKSEGRIEIKFARRIDSVNYETRECDLGHKHKVKKQQLWLWGVVELKAHDVEKIVEFLR